MTKSVIKNFMGLWFDTISVQQGKKNLLCSVFFFFFFGTDSSTNNYFFHLDVKILGYILLHVIYKKSVLFSFLVYTNKNKPLYSDY